MSDSAHRDAEDRAPKPIAEVTVFEKRGDPLTKFIKLVDGRITNDDSMCAMSAGRARRVALDLGNIAALAEIINKMNPREAYAIGRLREGLPDSVRIVTADRLTSLNVKPDVAARTKVDLVFVAGAPAICLLDVDLKGVSPDAKRMIRERGVWGALCAVVPALANVARVIRQSTSTGLSNKATGERYPASGGFHAAIAVADGAPTSRAFWPPFTIGCGSPALAGGCFRAPVRFWSARLSTKLAGARSG
jgi:hypothetical protein